MKKRIIWIAILIIIVLIFSVFITKPKTTDGVVKIVAIFPLTGGVASWGESSKIGTDIAVQEINKKGGINGKKIEIDYQDHKCDPKVALSIFTEKSIQNKFFTSSSCSGTVLAIAPVLDQNNAFLLAQVVASVKISKLSNNIFRNWPIETKQAQLVSEEILKNGYKKIGVIYEETDYAKGLKLELDKNLGDKGIEIISESFVSNSTDLRTQITKIKESAPEALFISTQSESSSEVLLKQLSEIGYMPKIFVNDIILNSEKLTTAYANILDGAIGGVYVMDQKKVDYFSKKYEDEFAKCSHVNACLIAYDSIHLIADAISKDESVNGVSNYFRKVKYSGMSGDISFDENNDRSGIGYVLSKLANGKIINIK